MAWPTPLPIFFLCLLISFTLAREHDVWSIGNVELKPDASRAPSIQFGFWRGLHPDCAKSKINPDGCTVPEADRRISNKTCIGTIVASNEWQTCNGTKNRESRSTRWRVKKNTYKYLSSRTKLTIEVVRKEEIHENATTTQDSTAKATPSKDSTSAKPTPSKESNVKPSPTGSQRGNPQKPDTSRGGSRDSNSSKDSNGGKDSNAGKDDDTSHASSSSSDSKESKDKPKDKPKDKDKGKPKDKKTGSDKRHLSDVLEMADTSDDSPPPSGQTASRGGKKDGPVVQVRVWNAEFAWDSSISIQLDLPCSKVNTGSGVNEVLCTSKNNLQSILEPSSALLLPEDFKKTYW